MILSEDGRIDKALDHGRELTDMYPDDGPMWATRSMIESLAGNYATFALEFAGRAVELEHTGFNESLAMALALSGNGDHEDAITALKKGESAALNRTDGKEDEIYYRYMGQFEVLAGNESAVESLKKAREITVTSYRPKILALYGVALLTRGRKEEAQEEFKSAMRDPGRHYKVEDELAFALCELGAGGAESGVSSIQYLVNEHSNMKGLMLETSALLKVMQTCEVDGCAKSITLIDNALDTQNL